MRVIDITNTDSGPEQIGIHTSRGNGANDVAETEKKKEKVIKERHLEGVEKAASLKIVK